jgi:hypothetical protein
MQVFSFAAQDHHLHHRKVVGGVLLPLLLEAFLPRLQTTRRPPPLYRAQGTKPSPASTLSCALSALICSCRLAMHLLTQFWTIVGLTASLSCGQAQRVALPEPAQFAGEGARELRFLGQVV